MGYSPWLMGFGAIFIHTPESLGVFSDAKQYLTSTHEHNLVSLTTAYVQRLGLNSNLQTVIEADGSFNEAEQSVFLQGLKLFQNAAATTESAVGWPSRIEP